jgi:hypothetical protein
MAIVQDTTAFAVVLERGLNTCETKRGRECLFTSQGFRTNLEVGSSRVVQDRQEPNISAHPIHESTTFSTLRIGLSRAAVSSSTPMLVCLLHDLTRHLTAMVRQYVERCVSVIVTRHMRKLQQAVPPVQCSKDFLVHSGRAVLFFHTSGTGSNCAMVFLNGIMASMTA